MFIIGWNNNIPIQKEHFYIQTLTTIVFHICFNRKEKCLYECPNNKFKRPFDQIKNVNEWLKIGALPKIYQIKVFSLKIYLFTVCKIFAGLPSLDGSSQTAW